MKREIFEIQNELRKARSEIASLRSLVKAQSHKPFRIALTKADTGGYPAESTTTGMYPVVFLDPAFGGDHVERQAEVRLRIRQLLPVHIPVNTEVPVWNYAGGYYTAYAGAGGESAMCCDWMELVNTTLKNELALTSQEKDDLDAALEACCPQSCEFNNTASIGDTYDLVITISGVVEQGTATPHSVNGDYGVTITKVAVSRYEGTFLIEGNECFVTGRCDGIDVTKSILDLEIMGSELPGLTDTLILASNLDIGSSPWSNVPIPTLFIDRSQEDNFATPDPNFSNVTITFSGS